MTQTFNMDCYDYMKALPDNAFDLLIADPPYGDCDGSWGGMHRFEDYTGRFARYRRGRGSEQGSTDTEPKPEIPMGGGWFQPYRKGSREGHGREDTTGAG